MIILVTNDDGIRADGLSALADSLGDLGRVIVVAPELEQSASSHAITLDKPLRITEHEEDRYAVSGTPTDCVLLAIRGILDERPGLLVSGINQGPNMGEDVTYSGTVAAALEGGIMGIPSIAVSVASWEPVPFDPAAEIARELAGKMIDYASTGCAFWNVNIPPLTRAELKGIRVTKLGSRIYEDIIIRKTDPRGRDYFWIGGNDPGWRKGEGTDFAAVSDGYVSVTPLCLDLTDYKSIVSLKELNREWTNE
jgi:5'-nucleotidase